MPPCAELIISKKIPRVVVAIADPNPKVSGRGIQMLRDNGVEVIVGVLENEARELNKSLFTNQILHRPYIILKWAQSNDGFIDIERTSREEKPPARISNDFTAVLAHKLRTEVQAIMVGTRTALLDNPQLTARKWFGENPTRIVIDRENKLSADLAIFDNTAPTIVLTDISSDNSNNKEEVTYIPINFSQNCVEQITQHLFDRNIYSLLVEGGSKTISSFIEKNLWDEAFVEISDISLFSGVQAPEIQGKTTKTSRFLNSTQIRLQSKISRNFT
jgi:diaminohydroxyphosphoribosylaminopyrimidine deaminase/5-amino-6-(5-phosphoribosylamino)uracil reductase